MKRLAIVILAALTLWGCAGSVPGANGAADEPAKNQISLKLAPERIGFRGIWISQFDMERIFTSGGVQRDRGDFYLLAKKMLTNCRAMGFNNVFVQTHPYGDSFYPSAISPWSEFVTGGYGAGSGYDPFGIIAQICGELGLKLHAWINPLRLMTPEQMKLIGDGYSIRRWYENGEGQVTEWNGRCWLDPAFPEVRELIAATARELCGYGVAGIHIDDYFYPAEDPAFDEKGYAKFGGEKDLGEFRRDNINALVKELYRTAHGSGVSFGVSPAGNPDNDYESMFADVFLWCRKPGYADYVIPQLYFGFEHGVCPFRETLDRWKDMTRSGAAELYIGLTLTKAGLEFDKYALEGATEWAENSDILKRSVRYARKAECRGVCVFSYSYLADPVTGKMPEKTAAEARGLLEELCETRYHP